MNFEFWETYTTFLIKVNRSRAFFKFGESSWCLHEMSLWFTAKEILTYLFYLKSLIFSTAYTLEEVAEKTKALRAYTNYTVKDDAPTFDVSMLLQFWNLSWKQPLYPLEKLQASLPFCSNTFFCIKSWTKPFSRLREIFKCFYILFLAVFQLSA